MDMKQSPVKGACNKHLQNDVENLGDSYTDKQPSHVDLFREAHHNKADRDSPEVELVLVNGKELWDALNAKFGATDVGSELYIMESFHDIRMVNSRYVVEQAHEIQCIAKELELLKCASPNKFVVGCIIAKLPPSWRNFATTLKHKRQEISVENLIASLDVEEKARAKDTTEKGEGQSSANMVQKKPYIKNKGNNKPSFNKPMKTTTFKKKKMINKAGPSSVVVVIQQMPWVGLSRGQMYARGSGGG
ncbi:hypothetical protein QYE76_037924 [Lolium multiflorum]|uniref:Uncharacterized protein n=1 Tax=Lolium multiflorum TaxID=4521 RepID=A0AAD8T707_LOLMU|nr:hypothetical protein QYE76_037924 [Lolium multiflorum]